MGLADLAGRYVAADGERRDAEADLQRAQARVRESWTPMYRIGDALSRRMQGDGLDVVLVVGEGDEPTAISAVDPGNPRVLRRVRTILGPTPALPAALPGPTDQSLCAVNTPLHSLATALPS